MTTLYAYRSGLLKLGISDNAKRRNRNFQTQSSVGGATEWTIEYPTRARALRIEGALKLALAEWRAHGEWYRLSRGQSAALRTFLDDSERENGVAQHADSVFADLRLRIRNRQGLIGKGRPAPHAEPETGCYFSLDWPWRWTTAIHCPSSYRISKGEGAGYLEENHACLRLLGVTIRSAQVLRALALEEPIGLLLSGKLGAFGALERRGYIDSRQVVTEAGWAFLYRWGLVEPRTDEKGQALLFLPETPKPPRESVSGSGIQKGSSGSVGR